MSSSRKKIKKEPCPSPSRETVPLYKLVSGARKRLLVDPPYRIYPISPYVGWSFMKEAFKFVSGKELCYVFALPNDNLGVGEMFQAVSGENPWVQPTEVPEIHVFVPFAKNPAESLHFAFFLPPDQPDLNPEQVPVISILNLELVTGSGYKCEIELKMSPVFSSIFDGTTDESVEEYRERFFHGFVDKNHPQWRRELGEFLTSKSGFWQPTIQIKGSRSTPIISKGFEVAPQTVLTPTFSLLDKENKRHKCHLEVLEESWPFIRKKLEENPTISEIKIGGGSETVSVLLHHFYYPQKTLPHIHSFGLALELLKVAHQFEISKLIALAVDTLINKMGMAESTQLMELYVFIRQLRFKIQVFYKLWPVLLIRITDGIVNERKRLDRTGSILCLQSFTDDGYFQLDLLQELVHDLSRPRDEDEAQRLCQQIKAKKVIYRFKDVVLDRLSSKLRTNHIKL